MSENVIVSQLIFTVGVMITRRSCSMCVEYSSVSISSSHFQFGWMGEDWWWNNLEISQVNADETSVREIASFHRRRLYFVDFSSQSIVNYTRRLLLLSRKWSLRSKRVYFSILRLFSFHFHIGALFFGILMFFLTKQLPPSVNNMLIVHWALRRSQSVINLSSNFICSHSKLSFCCWLLWCHWLFGRQTTQVDFSFKNGIQSDSVH